MTNEIVTMTAAGIVTPMQERAAANPLLVYLATQGADLSRLNVKSRLDGFADFMGYPDALHMDWTKLTYTSALAYRSFLQNRDKVRPGAKALSASSVNTVMVALRGIAEVACNLHLLSSDELRAIKSIKQLKTYRSPAGRQLDRNETRQLFREFDLTTAKGNRDKAILGLLLGCGLRRAEVPGILMKNVDLAACSVKLVGKGNKERKVFLTPEVKTLVVNWLKHRGTADGYLFGRLTKNGKTLKIDAPMHPTAISQLVQAYWDKASDDLAAASELGLRPAKVTPHDLRRTFATRLLEKNVDIVMVKNLMGHANVRTTANYDRRGENEMKEAMRNFSL